MKFYSTNDYTHEKPLNLYKGGTCDDDKPRKPLSLRQVTKAVSAWKL